MGILSFVVVVQPAHYHSIYLTNIYCELTVNVVIVFKVGDQVSRILFIKRI